MATFYLEIDYNNSKSRVIKMEKLKLTKQPHTMRSPNVTIMATTTYQTTGLWMIIYKCIHVKRPYVSLLTW